MMMPITVKLIRSRITSDNDCGDNGGDGEGDVHNGGFTLGSI